LGEGLDGLLFRFEYGFLGRGGLPHSLHQSIVDKPRSPLPGGLRNNPIFFLLQQSHPLFGQLPGLTYKIPFHRLHLSLGILSGVPDLYLVGAVGVLEAAGGDGRGDIVLGVWEVGCKG